MKNYLKLSRVNKTVKRSPTQVNQLIIYFMLLEMKEVKTSWF